MKQTIALLSLLLLVTSNIAQAESFPVRIQIGAAKPTGPLKPIWRFFGADEPNYAYMKHGSELLGELGDLKKDEVFFRTHSLLVTGKGEHGLKWGSTDAYNEDAAGNPLYDWTIVDRIFDAYRSNGVRPYVQIGFMPKALSVKPEPYRHQFPNAKYEDLFGGWAYPPKDFAKWEELVYQWAKHCVTRYGEKEVLHWYWQTWNEPNIDYWRGTREEFFKLHDHAIRAVRRAIPGARVGGPDLAGGKGGDFLESFLNHCLKGVNRASGEKGTPLDFISFHAKGSPTQTDGHVRMGISSQLSDIDGAFGVVAKYPELKNTPIVIGESDPEGCAACQGANLAYRNGTMYSSYTAASFPRKLDLAEKHGVNLEGALTWAFEFEGQRYFAGFRTLATRGIDKPVLNVFRMFSRMGGQRLRVESDAAGPLDELLKTGVRGKPDVSALAGRSGRRITVLVWHYHDDDVPGAGAAITLDLAGVPTGSPSLTRMLIDKTHSNSFSAWRAMGSPQAPTAEQILDMEKASQLARATDKTEMKSADGHCEITFTLARQGVTLLELEWP
jgi:xylan 1,4-beta-xylosidase